MKEKYYVLLVDENGPELREFLTVEGVQGLMDDLAAEGTEPDIKTKTAVLDFDESDWAIVIKGNVVQPKTKVVQVTKMVWEAE